MADTLYHRLGGARQVRAAVDLFYGKVLRDERLRYVFKSTNLRRQLRRQATQLGRMLQGNGSAERARRAARGRLARQGLKTAHQETLRELAGETLGELKVPEDLAREILDAVRAV